MAELINNKLFHVTCFIVLNIIFFIFVFLPSVKKVNTDFPNYYVSSNMFLDGKDLKQAYDNVEFNKQVLLYGIENQFVSFIPYPPVNALLMIPFARIEPLTAKFCWNILNYAFFMLSVYFISKISGLNFYLTGIIFFISGYAFVNNFFFGQAYLLVLILFSASVYYLFNGKDIQSALLLSISVLLKFYTIFFLIIFLCRRKYRMVIASVSFIVLLNLLVFIITGFDINFFYYNKIMPRISDGWVGTVYASEFQSVLSLLHTLFYFEPSLNPFPLTESPELYFILKYFFYFGILMSSVFIVLNSKKDSDKNIFNLQISLFCFVCILLLPVNASYQYVILIPAITILVKYYVLSKKYFMTGLILCLFLIMNSPLAVYIVSITKNQPYFFLGYIKLFIVFFFWLNNIFLLKKLSLQFIKRSTVLRYSFVYVFLVLVISRMSLSLNRLNHDGASNLLTNPSYLISMPASYYDKIIFTECLNEKFTLSSNFGFRFDRENVFDPGFINEEEIYYQTIDGKKISFKKINTEYKNEIQTILKPDPFEVQLSNDKSMKCFSKEGQIFLTHIPSGKTIQMTSDNSFNTKPVFYDNDSKILFCSDRKRGVGFTTLYEIKIK